MLLKNIQYILICLFCILSIGAYSQKSLTEDADNAFKLKHYYEAIELYKKSYSKVKNNKAEKARIKFSIAECYRMSNNMKQAESWYKRVLKSNYPEPKIVLYYANALRANNKFEEAEKSYKKYLEKFPDDTLAKMGLEASKLSVEWTKNPTRFLIANERSINSKANDFAGTYGDKLKRVVIFTSSREAAMGSGTDGWTGGSFTDLFITGKDRKGVWSTPEPMLEPINSEVSEGAACLNSRFNTIYFTRCRQEKSSKLGCHIFVAEKTGTEFGDPQLIELGNDSVSIGHPYISADELALYFASDMPGGEGGRDIWVVKRASSSEPFGSPENLGPAINSPGNEMFPSVPKEGVIYFASDYHLGLGGLDLFKSEKDGEIWKTPENLKIPFNSTADDYAIVFEDENQEKGFFTSNREGGRGGDDIYSFYLPPLIYTIQGMVKDDSTRFPMKGVIIKIAGSDGSAFTDTTDDKGIYYFDQYQISPKTTYEVSILENDYFNNISEITTVGLIQSRGLVHDVYLMKIPDRGIELPEILYDLGKWDLKPIYEKSLDGLIKTMNDNPNIVVELGSHTDIRGKDDDNKELSLKRAQSVVDYVITRGIDQDRLVAKGYGESIPSTIHRDRVKDGVKFHGGTILDEVYINSLTTSTQKEAAHQLNRRTEFKVVRKDFVPKSSGLK